MDSATSFRPEEMVRFFERCGEQPDADEVWVKPANPRCTSQWGRGVVTKVNSTNNVEVGGNATPYSRHPEGGTAYRGRDRERP